MPLPTAHIKSQSYENNNSFLLVSDGISNLLSPDDILEIINDEYENYSEKLCIEAVKSGSSDDVSAIFIRFISNLEG